MIQKSLSLSLSLSLHAWHPPERGGSLSLSLSLVVKIFSLSSALQSLHNDQPKQKAALYWVDETLDPETFTTEHFKWSCKSQQVNFEMAGKASTLIITKSFFVKHPSTSTERMSRSLPRFRRDAKNVGHPRHAAIGSDEGLVCGPWHYTTGGRACKTKATSQHDWDSGFRAAVCRTFQPRKLISFWIRMYKSRFRELRGQMQLGLDGPCRSMRCRTK